MGKKKDKLKDQPPVDDLDLKVKYLIDHFDFDKVHRTMIALDWKWQHIEDQTDPTSRVPTIERMKESARYLLLKAGSHKDSYWATGGFHAQRFKNGNLQLQFVLTEYGTLE